MSAILYYSELAAAAYVALTLALYMLSLVLPLAGALARLLASYVCLIAAASYGVLISILLRLVGYGGVAQWAVAGPSSTSCCTPPA